MSNKDEIVNLKETGKIVLPKIDLKEFIGTKTTIEKIEEKKGQFGYYVLFSSPILKTLENAKGEPIEIRATKSIGLQEDKEGNIGWGDDTRMDNFLKRNGVEHYKDLVGAEIVVQIKVNGENKAFLNFE